ncbi:MAG: ATP-binding cassette domain-containing protein [Deltaproteobacteria bacterium]|nr:ATP-binding cassette domain-containing protein [Deltaproteobacteria bacterium]
MAEERPEEREVPVVSEVSDVSGIPEIPEAPEASESGTPEKNGPPRGEKEDLRRLLSLLRPHAKTIFLAVLSMVLAAASTAGMAWLIKPLLDHVFYERDLAMLNFLTVLTLAVYSSAGVFTFFQAYFMNKVGYTIVNDLRVKLYSRIESQSLVFFHKRSSGELIGRVVNDVSLIQGAVTQVVTGVVLDFCKVVGLLGVLAARDPVLTLLGLVAMPLMLVPLVRWGKKLRTLATGSQEIMGALISILTETFQGVQTVQSHNRTEWEIKRFSRECKRNVDNLMRAVTVKSFSSSAMEIAGGLCVGGVIWYGGHTVIAGRSTPGTFFSFMTALLLLYEPLKRLTRIHNEAQQGLSAARRIFEVLDTPFDVASPEDPANPEVIKGEIEYRNVTFSYEPGRPALNGVSLKINPGEMLALVGPSGGGKTSVANLLPRFYDPSGGEVLIDGVNVNRMDLRFLRSRIALVNQNTTLFRASARDNISYGKPDATIEEIEKAAKNALADGFIKELPNGYDENIGEMGQKLSGGQKQRIAIARAILKDAPILILDEATSALDAESEKYVQRALDNLTRGRTTLVIAHRLSTIGRANRVAVIKDGTIAEIGTRRELMEKKGEYHKLHMTQFRDGTGDPDAEPFYPDPAGELSPTLSPGVSPGKDPGKVPENRGGNGAAPGESDAASVPDPVPGSDPDSRPDSGPDSRPDSRPDPGPGAGASGDRE